MYQYNKVKVIKQQNKYNQFTTIKKKHMYQYRPNEQQAKALKDRMRNGTGASRLLQAQNAPTHYIDSLQRFKKDFAYYDKEQRQTDKHKRQLQLQKKRLEQLQRENKRWQMVQDYQDKLKIRQQVNGYNQYMGAKRTANTTSLAYNPINLSYDSNPQGDKLKIRDQDTSIRRFVRAKNMQDRGNSKYNPINGQSREGIQKIIPVQLNQRYNRKLQNHYDHMRLKAPSVDLSMSQNHRYY